MINRDKLPLNVGLNIPLPFNIYPNKISSTIGMILCKDVRKTIVNLPYSSFVVYHIMFRNKLIQLYLERKYSKMYQL